MERDGQLSPQENAAKYFKQYTKAKTAEKILQEQLQRGRSELVYLESVLQQLQQAVLVSLLSLVLTLPR